MPSSPEEHAESELLSRASRWITARAELAARNPQKRLVQPEQVANAVAWLCLPGSEAVTGQAIAVTGGEVM
jgi:NAD(P)-dependent dehydrogenase (short-subunit alcohol dehydrogenase family)